MKRYLLIAVVVSAMLLSCCGVNSRSEKTEYYCESETTASVESTTENITAETLTEEVTEELTMFVPEYEGDYGSAGYITDRTLVVSIFADDYTSQWNMNSYEDKMLIADTLTDMGIAVEWLEENTARYEKGAEFIYDWRKYPELKYETQLHGVMVSETAEEFDVQELYLEQNVSSEELKAQFEAENIIYVFFFNTDYENTVNSWTFSDSYDPFYAECVNIFLKHDGFDTYPSTYAHEFLHCFGAPDLYYENAQIPQYYVEHCEETDCNDIMFRTYEGSAVYSDFTELDAYYVGLTDQCDEVDKWSLGLSDYINWYDLPVTYE